MSAMLSPRHPDPRGVTRRCHVVPDQGCGEQSERQGREDHAADTQVDVADSEGDDRGGETAGGPRAMERRHEWPPESVLERASCFDLAGGG